MNRIAVIIAIMLLLFMNGCSLSGYPEQYKTKRNRATHPAPKATRGKPYTINGKTYRPLLSAAGFRQEGVASWYGKDFHAKQTANGERYDMYGMTAAHKELPFGTKVKVTNKKNGRSIIVRINDRGPFVANRIIDLTKTGAEKIGMIDSGTTPVELRVVGKAPHTTKLATNTKTSKNSGIVLSSNTDSSSTNTNNAGANANKNGNFYLQVGAFTSKDNASRLVDNMKKRGIEASRTTSAKNNVWCVQAGPYASLYQAEQVSKKIGSLYPSTFVVVR